MFKDKIINRKICFNLQNEYDFVIIKTKNDWLQICYLKIKLGNSISNSVVEMHKCFPPFPLFFFPSFYYTLTPLFIAFFFLYIQRRKNNILNIHILQ
jgi:hypothetical protein